MKIPKEYTLLIILGLYLASYVLEATVDALNVSLAHPYEFLNAQYFASYPFSTAVIAIRGLAVFMTPLFLLSFFKGAHLGKGGALLVVGALAQLYALQEIATATTLLPLEWSLSLAFGSAALAIPAAFHLLLGLFGSAKDKLSGEPYAAPQESLEE